MTIQLRVRSVEKCITLTKTKINTSVVRNGVTDAIVKDRKLIIASCLRPRNVKEKSQENVFILI